MKYCITIRLNKFCKRSHTMIKLEKLKGEKERKLCCRFRERMQDQTSFTVSMKPSENHLVVMIKLDFLSEEYFALLCPVMHRA